jgi:hypothetical protein
MAQRADQSSLGVAGKASGSGFRSAFGVSGFERKDPKRLVARDEGEGLRACPLRLRFPHPCISRYLLVYAVESQRSEQFAHIVEAPNAVQQLSQHAAKLRDTIAGGLTGLLRGQSKRRVYVNRRYCRSWSW